MSMPNVVSYKEVQIPSRLLGLINHMPTVEGYREDLRILGSQWDLLTILGQMSGTGMDMTETRTGFQQLTSELLSQLGLETLRTTIQEIGSKAQVAVDIVIRNLFERTADIGFLATDDDIRRFLKAGMALEKQQDGNPQQVALLRTHREEHAPRVEKLVARFQEYVAKYSVYFNIILLDTHGNVLVQLDPENNIRHSSDPLIEEALTTHAEYVEIFRHSDLLESENESLIYAYRVTETNDSNSRALGVLCLCFRFENEMQGVFKNLRSEGDWSVMTLLDKNGRVIASSDPFHIPLGVVLERALNEEFKVTRFAGRAYLAKTCATKGYQGYFGLGWSGHVMIPIEHAFDKGTSVDLPQRVEQKILDAVLNDPQLFSDDLRSIPVQADSIQDELERTVWNGNVRERDGQSKVLLWNISDAGARTKRVFEQSIGNLHATVVSGILKDVEFQAALAVDIMDRNLYERANDCRWWALTSDFRELLSKPELTAQDAKQISSILAYINGLYTVYSNLFVYDAKGRIVAVSQSSEAHRVNTRLGEEWVRETLSLHGSQCYSVSSFDATPLYEDRNTYIYGAAITHSRNEGSVVGGIGIVFDSEPQFREMLRDSLPRSEKGTVVTGCFGVFTDRKGRIISSTNQNLLVGQFLTLDPAFFALSSGRGTSKIIEFEGNYYAVGSCVSAGYREFKINDGYQNDVVALIFVPLADATKEKKSVRHRRDVGMTSGRVHGNGQDCIELATFYIGDKWLGIKASSVREAVTAQKITALPCEEEFVVGTIMYREKIITVMDIRTQLRQTKEPLDLNSPIVVVETDSGCIGLVVDALGEIPQVCMDRVSSGKTVMSSTESYIECLIKPADNSDKKELLVVIDPTKMLKILMEKQETATLKKAGLPKEPELSLSVAGALV